MAGCLDTRHENPYTYWTHISPSIDTITWMLEKYMEEDSSAYSINSLLARLHDECNKKGDAATARYLYWQGRWQERNALVDSSRLSLQAAIEHCDTVKSQYDFRRIRLILERLNHTPVTVRYKNLTDDERFYQKKGDILMMANVAQQLGQIFLSTLQNTVALKYFLSADSLLAIAKTDNYRLKNRINTAMAYHHCGDSAKADSTLRPLLAEPLIRADRLTLNTVLRNMHIITGDRRYLLAAYRMLDSLNSSHENDAIFLVSLSMAYAQSGMTDSAGHYAALAYASINDVTDYNWKELILKSYAERLWIVGDIDSVAIIQHRFISTLDTLGSVRHTQELNRMENEHGIRKADEMHLEQRQKEKVRALYTLLAVITVASVVVGILYRRNVRHTIRHIQFQLETEKDRRKLLSLSMMIEERNNFINILKDEIAQLKASSEDFAVARLDALVRRHETEQVSKEYFFDAFERLNPMFIPNLKGICPDLPESLLQLSCLIVTGLDNKRIADMLNVRPASINQSRWRLRSRLNLNKSDSLEEKLRSLI